MYQSMLMRFIQTVKFDGENLPPIFNALETSNNGQKLVLEVAVRVNDSSYVEIAHINAATFG